MASLWKGLFGGIGSLVKTQSPRRENNPQRRLDRFKQLHNAVVQAVSRASVLRTPGPLVGQLYRDLFAISELLAEEIQLPPPHACLEYAADPQVYNAIGRAGSACRHEGIVYQTVLIFGSFLDSGSDAFIESRPFARTLMRFAMHILDTRSMFVNEDTEAQLIEVLFEIATKIRHDTNTFLPVWFSAVTRPHGEEHDSPNKNFIGTRQDDNFPLCYLFMDRMHKEGRIGDFARTGLLYLFECASKSDELDKWMVTSDIPTLMATALGALYSPLSRELSIRLENHNIPLILALSDYDADAGTDVSKEIPNVNSPDHAANMETFLSALVFWQDVLQHCKSSDVRRTLLDHFQILFLQQLLYPSILESSDSDGGSSVAVLTYIADMLVVLEETDLAEMILDYLFAVRRGTHSAASSVSASPSVEERRRFLLRTTQSGNMEDSLDPSTFNLADMLRNALASDNPQAFFAALNLHSVVVTRRPKYVIGVLVNTLPLIDDVPGASLDTIDASTQVLLRYASTLGDSTSTNKLYTNTCLDVRSQLQASSRSDSAARRRKLLDMDDVSFSIMINSLTEFLTNDVDVNLALTQAFVALLTCPEVRLDGVLTPGALVVAPPAVEVDENLSRLLVYMDDEEAAAVRFLETQSRPSSLQPRLVSVIHELTQSVQSLRSTFPKLDYILAKRSAILLTAEQRPTSSAGLSDFSDTPETPQQRRYRSVSRRALSRSSNAARDPSIPSTPGRSTARRSSAGPNSRNPAVTPRSDSTPRGRRFSPAGALRDGDHERDASGSPTPRAKSAVTSRRTGSFIMSPFSLTSALLGTAVAGPSGANAGSSQQQQQQRGEGTASRTGSSVVFLQPPPVFELDDHEGEMLKRIVTFDGPGDDISRDSETESNGKDDGNGGKEQTQSRSASLSHVLTNAVLLRSFILELAAILQLRTIIFDEARVTL